MKKLNNKKNQLGASFISWLLGISLILMVAITLVQLIPSYIQYNSVITIVDDIAANSQSLKQGKRALRGEFSKRLNINGLDSVIKVDDLKIKTIKGGERGRQLVLAYQVKKHWLGNIDLLLQFDHSVKIGEKAEMD